MAKPMCRPAGLDDAELASDLITASYPDLPEDPVLKRYFWKHPRAGWRTARFVAELHGQPVALLGWTHGPWEQAPERNCYVEVYLDRARLKSDMPTSLWEWIAREAQA